MALGEAMRGRPVPTIILTDEQRQFIDKHYLDIVRFCYSVYGRKLDEETCKDLISHVSIEVMRYVWSHDVTRTKTTSFIYTIVKSAGSHFLRSLKRKNKPAVRITDLTSNASYSDMTDLLLGGKPTDPQEMAMDIDRILQRFSVRDQDVFRMRLSGALYREIGEKHGITKQGAKMCHNRICATIRRILTDDYIKS